MIDRYLNRFKLNTKNFGVIPVLRPVPKEGDIWGVLAPLQETPWGDNIPIIDGDVFSEAVIGFAMPLMQVIGVEPHILARRFPLKTGTCADMKTCLLANQTTCRPHPDIPECYSAPGFKDYETRQAASIVARAWGENRYVLVIESNEFTL